MLMDFESFNTRNDVFIVYWQFSNTIRPIKLTCTLSKTTQTSQYWQVGMPFAKCAVTAVVYFNKGVESSVCGKSHLYTYMGVVSHICTHTWVW